jgi:TolB protein
LRRVVWTAVGLMLALTALLFGLRAGQHALAERELTEGIAGSTRASHSAGRAANALAPAASTTPTPTSAAGTATVASSPASVPSAPLDPAASGLVILSLREGSYAHLFAYRPPSAAVPLALTRLTDGPWDDLTPALHPDGRSLAFASNRDGFWDLYRLDLADGAVTRLTTTTAYDAHPTWSPDGLWLAYESYDPNDADGLEIWIAPADPASAAGEPLPLTADPAADFAPAWSPSGRTLAFVSDRGGLNEIWLADLDNLDQRFTNLGTYATVDERAPAWSSDGRWLTYSSRAPDGTQDIWLVDMEAAESRPLRLGAGEWSAFAPDGQSVLATVTLPNGTYLSGYPLAPDGLALPPLRLSGPVEGLTWSGSAPVWMGAPVWAEAVAALTPTPLWQAALAPDRDIPGGRRRVIPLEDVAAPNPSLNERVDESFAALRAAVSAAAGWDFLATLENAYVPLTIQLGPGGEQDWLYSGRAFSFNPAAMNAGWLLVGREDFGARSYWRVYLRARFQDGSQGRPLAARPWDFSLRYGGDPRFYEDGGGLATAMPSGYWVDFTALAQAYGWERLSALSTWRWAFPTSRFNQYVLTDGLDWRAAMLELYPAEALATATLIPTATATPSVRLRPTRTPAPPTPTRTATPPPRRNPAVPNPLTPTRRSLIDKP